MAALELLWLIQVPGGPRYADRQTGRRRRASADAARAAIYTAFILTARVFPLDVSQLPDSSSCRAKPPSTAPDRSYVQRAAFRVDGLCRPYGRSSGHRYD